MDKTLRIPDIKVSEIEDAYADVYNRPEKVKIDGEMVPNPETKEKHMNRIILETTQKVHEAYKAKQADSARKIAIENSKEYTADIEVM